MTRRAKQPIRPPLQAVRNRRQSTRRNLPPVESNPEWPLAASAVQVPQVVGAALREQRRRLNLTLKQVADRTGITKGFLSEIERDKAAPSVATLMRLRDALSLSVASLFRSSLPRVVRANQRQSIPFGGVHIRYSLLSAKNAHRMTIVLGELAPGAQSGKELHTISSDEEIILVLSGVLEVYVDGNTHVLNAGDTFTFDPRRPHRYENPSRTKTTSAICMLAPPPK